MSHQAEEQNWKINGMSCGHCRTAVEDAIRSIPGVDSVVVDLSAGTATVVGSPDMDKVVEAVSEAGYEAIAVGSQ